MSSNDPTSLMVPLTHDMIRRGARALDLWSDDVLRETIDAQEMAKRVLTAALAVEEVSDEQ